MWQRFENVISNSTEGQIQEPPFLQTGQKKLHPIRTNCAQVAVNCRISSAREHTAFSFLKSVVTFQRHKLPGLFLPTQSTTTDRPKRANPQSGDPECNVAPSGAASQGALAYHCGRDAEVAPISLPRRDFTAAFLCLWIRPTVIA